MEVLARIKAAVVHLALLILIVALKLIIALVTHVQITRLVLMVSIRTHVNVQPVTQANFVKFHLIHAKIIHVMAMEFVDQPLHLLLVIIVIVLLVNIFYLIKVFFNLNKFDLGWTGLACNQMLNNCLSLPCKNGASCQSSLNQYTCTCLTGFQGSDCSIQINVCNSNPCKNNGTCIASINQFLCSCPLGYIGLDCSIVYNFCQLVISICIS